MTRCYCCLDIHRSKKSFVKFDHPSGDQIKSDPANPQMTVTFQEDFSFYPSSVFLFVLSSWSSRRGTLEPPRKSGTKASLKPAFEDTGIPSNDPSQQAFSVDGTIQSPLIITSATLTLWPFNFRLEVSLIRIAVMIRMMKCLLW